MGIKPTGVGVGGREFQVPEEFFGKHPVVRGSLCGKAGPLL